MTHYTVFINVLIIVFYIYQNTTMFYSVYCVHIAKTKGKLARNSFCFEPRISSFELVTHILLSTSIPLIACTHIHITASLFNFPRSTTSLSSCTPKSILHNAQANQTYNGGCGHRSLNLYYQYFGAAL